MIHVAGWFSGIQTQMEISVGMVIRDGLGIKACEIKRKKQDKAEGKNTHCGGKDTDGPREYSLV